MKLTFRRIEIYGFMSFDNEVFDFSEHPGMTLVCGKNNDIPNVKNGSGKTNLFSALLYVLFGQLQDKIKNEYIVNRYSGDKDMRVSLVFGADDAEYQIARGLKNGKLSYLELRRGGEDVSKSTIGETQDYLEREILRCDISIFLRTMFLTADKNYNFYTLKKQEKKDFVEKLFDIRAFGEMYQLIHRDILRSDKDMLACQSRLAVLNRTKSEYDERVAAYDSERAGRLSSAKAEILKAKTQYDDYKAKAQAKADTKLAKLKDAAEKLKGALEKQRDLEKTLTERIHSFEVQLGRDETQRETRRQAISKHADIMSKLCEKCRLTFEQHYMLDKYKADIETLTESMHRSNQEKDRCSAELLRVKGDKKKLADKMAQIDEGVKGAEARRQAALRQLALLEAKIKQLTAEYKKAAAEKNPYHELLLDNKKSLDEENARLSEYASKYKYMKFAEGIVSQETLRKFIIQDLIGLLNNRIQRYLMKLGSRYTVVFDSDMDYEFIIGDGKCDFQNFSAGERMRIMIATSFAFRDFMSIRNGLLSNVLILDEYFDSAIDSACVESIIGILKEYIQDYNQNIYVISHRQEVTSEQFDSVIQVEKTDGISKICCLK